MAVPNDYHGSPLVAGTTYFLTGSAQFLDATGVTGAVHIGGYPYHAGTTQAFKASRVLDASIGTTKGDILVHNGTTWVRLPVGTNGHAIIADSAQATGVKWASTGVITDHGGLTGLSDDDHGQYVIGDGSRTSSRVNLQGMADESQLEVYAYDVGQSVPVVAIRDNAANPLLLVNADGTGSFASQLTIAGDVAVTRTAGETLSNKTLDGSNAIQSAKGHRFWVHLAASDLNSALTQVVVPIGGIDSITYPHAMMRACKIVRASVVAMHADASTPPATWILDVFKNGASASTFTFNLNASFFVDTVTHGAPSAASWAAGDTWGVKVRGTSLDAVVVRIAIEFEST